MVRTYWAIAKVSFQEYFAYRGNLFFELLGAFMTTALSVVLWYGLFHTSGAEMIQGYTYPVMMVYILGVAFVEGGLHIQSQGMKQMDDIHDGLLNNYLLKPFHPYLFWFVDDMARKVLMSILSGLTIGAVLLIASPWVSVHVSLVNMVIFLLALLVAAPLHFLLFSVIILTTFWIGRSWGLTFVLRVTMGIATGALIPLSFFPDGVRHVLLVLPFQFFGYTPIQILLGRFSTMQTLGVFAQMFVWITGLLCACAIVYRRGLKVYGAYGG